MAKPKSDDRDIFEKALEDDRQKTKSENDAALLAMYGGGIAGLVGGGLGVRALKRILRVPAGRQRLEGVASIGGGLAGGYGGAKYAKDAAADKRKKRRDDLRRAARK